MDNRTAVEAARPANGTGGGFWARFEATVAASDAGIAISFEGRADCSFEALGRRARALAAALQDRGVGRGDRAVVLAANGPWFIELMLAAALAGFVLVPINTRLTATEVAYIFDNADPKIAFADGALALVSVPASAQSRYGSIVFSQESGGRYAWGMAWSYNSLSAARNRAVGECRRRGGRNCREIVWFRDACGALAIGDNNGYGSGWGTSPSIAQRYAMSTCRSANRNCRIADTRCAR